MENFKLPTPVCAAIALLEQAGFCAYTVGGCVRDLLLGRIPKDWDICTSATTSQMEAVFEAYQVIPTGKQFGTMTVILEGMQLEITTFRIEQSYEDGRHPSEITFTDDLRQDLMRRDFTINAMAYHPHKGMFDYFGGKQDLHSKCIRCVGDPIQRFGEDALRMVRAIRFSAVLGFTIEMKTLLAIEQCRDLIVQVSIERITAELNRILLCENVKSGLSLFLHCFGKEILPELMDCDGFDQNNYHHLYPVLEHSLIAAQKISPDLVLRLTMLLHDVGKPATYTVDEEGVGHFFRHAQVGAQMAQSILKRLCYPNHITQTVVLLISAHCIHPVMDERFARRLYACLKENSLLLCKVWLADTAAQNPLYCTGRNCLISDFEKLLIDIATKEGCFSIKDLKISGQDLLKLGIPQGKKIGEILTFCLERVLEDPSQNQKDMLLALAQEYPLN